MKVKPGYKQTEVGVIPEDWLVPQLQDLTPEDSPICYGIVQVGAFTSNGIPVLAIKNLNGDYQSGIHLASRSVEQPYTRSRIRPKDVLISVKGTTGRVGMVPDHFAGNISRDLARVRPNAELAAEFVFQILQSNLVQRRLSVAVVGTTRMELSISILKQIRVPLPPTKAEQEAIAEALSDADALVESLEQLVAKKRQIKRGAMQELLTGRRRLPGFTGEWETKQLGEIGESLIGLTYKPTDVRENGVLVLRSSNVFESGLRFEDNVYVEMDIPDKIMVKPGDILICVRNGSRELIGKCAKIDDRAKGMTFGAFMAVYRSTYHDFIYHQFQSDGINRQIHEHLGATINQITNRSLNSFRVPFPPDEAERAAIAAILSDMDVEIIGQEAKLAKARQVKQGMMQELLTGRIF
jgi:type I restriction enzyme S subunit